MSTAVIDEFDTGDIPGVGEHTENLAPYYIGPPAFRRPDATAELPTVRPDETGLGILAVPSAPYRRYRGRHRREPGVLPVLLVLVTLWAVGCGAALRMVGAW